MNRSKTEEAIKAAGLTAERVTIEQMEAEIESEHYFTAADGVLGELASDGVLPTPYERENLPTTLKLLTFCVLVLKNGFTVTGKSACASPDNFNAEIGRKIARENAIESMWPLFGFRLRDKISERSRETYNDIVGGGS